MKPTIQAHDGRYINLLDPAAYFRGMSRERLVKTIAFSLSGLGRFTAHADDREDGRLYTVAQHAVHVSQIVDREYAPHALHHDDGEIVTGDVSSPLKALIRIHTSVLDELSQRVDDAVFDALNIDQTYGADDVKRADWTMLATERAQLMQCNPGQGEWGWLEAAGIKPIDMRISVWGRELAYYKFIRRHNELTGDDVDAGWSKRND